MILISSSPFFLNLLKRNKHPHPLVYMRGFKYENLHSMLDFLYRGEANVHQENLDSFLAMADELWLKGLEKREGEVEFDLEKVSKRQGSSTTQNLFVTSREKTLSQKSKNDIFPNPSTETAIAVDHPFASTDIAEMDQKVKSMMSSSENKVGKKTTQEQKYAMYVAKKDR